MAVLNSGDLSIVQVSKRIQVVYTWNLCYCVCICVRIRDATSIALRFCSIMLLVRLDC